jgi:hypothetical protein
MTRFHQIYLVLFSVSIMFAPAADCQSLKVECACQRQVYRCKVGRSSLRGMARSPIRVEEASPAKSLGFAGERKALRTFSRDAFPGVAT